MLNTHAVTVEFSEARLTFDAGIVALRPALLSFARQLSRNPYDADDLIQETLSKACRSQKQFAPGSNLKGWLFTIMRNHFNTQFKNRRREPVTADDVLDTLGSIMPHQDWCVYSRDAERIISGMPYGQRAALMQISAGISYEDVAVSLGCEIGTIKSRVNRARRALKAEMGDIFTSREVYAA